MALVRRVNKLINCSVLKNYKYSQHIRNKHQQFEHQNDGSIYEQHRPLNVLQKMVLTVGSSLASVHNPVRGDMVAALAETTGYTTLRKLQLDMLNNETGCRILKDKPMINSTNVNINELIKKPAHTFGYNYAKFMMENGITSDTRSKVHYVDDMELAYIMNRYRQIHDFIHCLLGFSVSVPAEIVVKWFEAAHLGFPMNYLSVIFGPLAVPSLSDHQEIIKWIPWAFYNGRNTDLVLNVYFEERFDEDFEIFKKELGLTKLPYKPL